MKREEMDKAKQNIDKLTFLLEREVKKRGFDISLCLYDFFTGLWVEKNAHTQIYPASLIKMLYLLTALERLERGVLSLTDSHILREEDKYAGFTKVTGSGSLQFAEAGSVYTVKELLSLMISASDNVATNIMLDIIGCQAITAMASRLGLLNTRGTRKMFALDSPLPPNTSTAHELTEMLIALENKQVCSEDLKNLAASMMIDTENKNRIARYLINSDVLVANKIGTVDHMVGDMALLYFPQRPPLALTVIVKIPPFRLRAANAIGRRIAAKTIARLASTVVKELLK